MVPIKTPIINGELKQNSIHIPKFFHDSTSSASASPKVTLLAPKSFSFVICPLRSESECSGRVLTKVFKFWWSLVKISVKSKQISKSNLARKNVFHVKSPFSLQALLEEKEVLGILKKVLFARIVLLNPEMLKFFYTIQWTLFFYRNHLLKSTR